MNTTTKFVILFTALILSACSSSIYYDSEFQQGNTFSELESFSWYDPNTYEASSNIYIIDESVDTSIRKNINKELLSKNFKLLSNSDQADFLINYSIFRDEKTELKSYRSTHGYAAGWGFAGDYHVATSNQGYPIRNIQDTFVLDIINAKDKKLIWRGIAEGRMGGDQFTSEQKNKNFTDVVVNVLSSFPDRK